MASATLGIVFNSKFSAPPGLESLPTFGGVTKEDLINGSVRTWIQTERPGRRNGGKPADSTDRGTMENLPLNGGVTTPGFIRLPVCSPEHAFQSWDTSGNMPPGISNCGVLTFVDQTGIVLPKVEDCLQIIRNIEADGKTEWTRLVAGRPQPYHYKLRPLWGGSDPRLDQR